VHTELAFVREEPENLRFIAAVIFHICSDPSYFNVTFPAVVRISLIVKIDENI
jgi:hypothetical protein